AEPIGRALSLDARLEPGLGEYHLGSWEGLTYEALLKEHELWQNMARDPDWKPHGGESGRDVVERFGAVLDAIGARHAGERVILVSHGAAMSLFMSAALRGRLGEWYEPMHNCAISELVLVPGPELLRFNVADHLEGI
ncbi:MAG TPA: histidine phosphatase family protein, partial [Myxococcota bacterium]|nr:histidine phosphatase family protein [Myxococcota bacterium]